MLKKNQIIQPGADARALVIQTRKKRLGTASPSIGKNRPGIPHKPATGFLPGATGCGWPEPQRRHHGAARHCNPIPVRGRHLPAVCHLRKPQVSASPAKRNRSAKPRHGTMHLSRKARCLKNTFGSAVATPTDKRGFVTPISGSWCRCAGPWFRAGWAHPQGWPHG